MVDIEKECLNILEILCHWDTSILNSDHVPITLERLVVVCGLRKKLVLELCAKLTEEDLVKTIAFDSIFYRIMPKGSEKAIKHYGRE